METLKKNNLQIDSQVWFQALILVAKSWSFIDSKTFVPQNPFRENQIFQT